jgi:ABC-type branched-subunit amino acid transport system ATPase component/ABC-type branched-subunit amino acid transport system permease subunit
VVLILMPTFYKTGDIRSLTTALIYAIAALGLDLLVGVAGQLSLAHASFLGVGFFTAVQVGSRGSWVFAVVASVAATSLALTVVGLPSLRIRGLQVAIATLAFQLSATSFLFNQKWLVNQRELLRPSLFRNERVLYWVTLGCVLLPVLVLRRIRQTRAGRSFLAVRDIEPRVGTFGIEAGQTKLLAYAVSGAMVGLAGALFAIQQGSLTRADNFNLTNSLLLVAIVVVGGSRSAWGIVLGALLLRAGPIFARALPDAIQQRLDLDKNLPVAFAALLVASVVLQPEGIGGVLRDARGGLDRLLYARADPPSPRPQKTDLAVVAPHAAPLRDVPRPLSDRMPTASLLVGDDVGVQYGGVHALAGVSLEVRRGEIVGLIGANGAGKSTFFNAVSGLAPVTGSITYRGRELTTQRPSKRSGAGVVRTWQDMGLVRAETVRENVLLAQAWLARYPAAVGILGLGGVVGTERELRRRADMALELFGLTHLADETLGGLPYGTMRSVEIAAAVAAGPDLLMLDEASAGLTPEEAFGLGERFEALRADLGLTLVVIEHHVPLIARVCDYCYCLESGKLIAEGTPSDVTAQPRVVESFLGRGALAGSPA